MKWFELFAVGTSAFLLAWVVYWAVRVLGT